MDLGTILELAGEDQVDQAEEVNEDRAAVGGENQERGKVPLKRPHRRFSKEQNKALTMLMNTREKVSIADMKEWLVRHGRLFEGRTASETLAKLYNMRKAKKTSRKLGERDGSVLVSQAIPTRVTAPDLLLNF